MNAPAATLATTASYLDAVEVTFDELVATAPKVGWSQFSGANTVIAFRWRGTAVDSLAPETPAARRRARLGAALAKYRVIRDATTRPGVVGNPADLLIAYQTYEASIVEAETLLR